MIDLTALSNEQIYSLWDKGISYWQAEYQLTSSETRTRQETLTKLKDEHTKSEAGKLTHATFTDMMKTLFINPHDDELKQIDKDLHDNVIHAMNEDRLIALGFEVPRKVNSRPTLVPVDLVAHKVPKFKILSQKDRSIEKGSLKIEDVHFVWRRFVDEALRDAKNPTLSIPEIKDREARPQGRPSKSEIILTAYKHLDKTGVIDFTKPQKDAIHQVQSYIQNYQPDLYENGKGFGSETTRGYIAEDFSFKAL